MYKIQTRSRKTAKRLPYGVKFYLLPILFFVALIGVNAFIFLKNPQMLERPTRFNKSTNESRLDLSQHKKLLPVQEIKNLAAKEVPKTSIEKINLENVDGKLIYFVSLANNKQIAFDAETGDKLSDITEGDDSDESDLPEDFTPAIAFDEAQAIALNIFPEGTVSKIELVSSGDKVIYNVLLSDGNNIIIAADSGQVVQAGDETSDFSEPEQDAPNQTSTAPDTETAPSTSPASQETETTNDEGETQESSETD